MKLGALDLHLAGEGRHERIYERLGARRGGRRLLRRLGAERARSLGRRRLERLGGARRHARAAGLVRDLGRSRRRCGRGQGYKFEVHGADGQLRLKADPFAFHAECRRTASRIYRSTPEWGDDDWLERRRAADPLVEPLSIYEVRALVAPRARLAGLAEELVAYVREQGFTQVVPAGDAPPVLGLLGLPGDRVLRPAVDARRARRLPCARRRAAPGRDRGDPRLGAGPPPRRVRARASTGRRSTSTRTRAAAHTRTGGR